MTTMLPALKTIGGIIVAILAFGIMIFVHELGHYIAAKSAGVRVNEFSIGMGPALFKFGKGETQYALRAIPFGGFVAMEGEDEESDDSRSFGRVSLARRASILVAGAVMNVIFGMLLLFILATSMPYYGSTVIAEFDKTATSNEFLQVGDKITSVNGKRTRSFDDVIYQFMRDEDGHIDFVVERDGEEVAYDDIIFPMEEVQEGVHLITLDFKFASTERTVKGVFEETANQTKRVTKTVWSSLGDLVTGRVGLNQLTGPVGITKEIGTITSTGNWRVVLELVAMISINLGIVNLLPLPALDGGRLVLLIVEGIRGKKINPKVEMYVNGIGLLLLLLLMVVITFKDIINLF